MWKESLHIFVRVWTGRYFTGHLTTSTNKLFVESYYKFHKVTYAVPRINQSPMNPHDNFCVRRESTESVTKKVNWEKYGFPLVYKLSLPESNQHDILLISLPHISSVISWSWDWACDFKFYKWNIIVKHWHKYIITEYQCKQFTQAKKSYLIHLSNNFFFFFGRESGRE